MKHFCWVGFLVLSLTMVVAGCKDEPADKANKATDAQTGERSTPSKEDPEIKASLDKLSPEDQRLARAQRLCPVSEQPLGSMEVPPKMTIQGQTVFLCCASCEKEALAKADQTLAKVKELKEKAAASK